MKNVIKKQHSQMNYFHFCRVFIRNVLVGMKTKFLWPLNCNLINHNLRYLNTWLSCQKMLLWLITSLIKWIKNLILLINMLRLFTIMFFSEPRARFSCWVNCTGVESEKPLISNPRYFKLQQGTTRVNSFSH